MLVSVRSASVFTGAGTSQYVGDTVVPFLTSQGNTKQFIFQSIGSTDIVATPKEYLIPDETTILVSFARSGNSPESLAAVEMANQLVHQDLPYRDHLRPRRIIGDPNTCQKRKSGFTNARQSQ
jgi:glucose-6-phosphate isomerase